jgi:hypothetical protein
MCAFDCSCPAIIGMLDDSIHSRSMQISTIPVISGIGPDTATDIFFVKALAL